MSEVAEVVEFAEERQRVLDLRNKVEDNNWELAAALHEVNTNNYHIAWGFNSWREYVEQEVDFEIRKVQYLVSIQEWFGRMHPSVQKWIRDMGWTKAKELVGIVNEENAAEWKNRLEGKSYRDIMKVLKEGSESESEDDSDAAPDKQEEKETITNKKFGLAPSQLENVDNAIAKAKDVSGSESENHCIDMICLDYLATNGAVEDVSGFLKKIEDVVGLKIIAIDPSEGSAIVFGDDTLDSLIED
jgi:hypothetical protein